MLIFIFAIIHPYTRAPFAYPSLQRVPTAKRGSQRRPFANINNKLDN